MTAVIVDLPCDCCGFPLRMEHVVGEERLGGGRGRVVEFTCSHCPQWVGIDGDKRIWRTIVPKLFGSGMTKGTPMYDQYLDYKLACAHFEWRACVLGGVATTDEAIAGLRWTAEQVAAEPRAARAWFERREEVIATVRPGEQVTLSMAPRSRWREILARLGW